MVLQIQKLNTVDFQESKSKGNNRRLLEENTINVFFTNEVKTWYFSIPKVLNGLLQPANLDQTFF